MSQTYEILNHKTTTGKVRPPFAYFGGKSLVADVVWTRLGDPPRYIEPFFGSGSVLFNRPKPTGSRRRYERANDKDCFIANFFRAVTQDPEQVAAWSNWPANEADLHARHAWLIEQKQNGFQARMFADPDFCDFKIAGWWVWGMGLWVGGGFCLSIMNKRLDSHRSGIHCLNGYEKVNYLSAVAQRLRNVVVDCGDWSRSVKPAVLFKQKPCAVFLDPPYSAKAGRHNNLYTEEDTDIAHDVVEWAIANGNDKRLRIAVCGYEGEHRFPNTWDAVRWKANGGYARKKGGAALTNRFRETIWFSPHCLKTEQMTFLT